MRAIGYLVSIAALIYVEVATAQEVVSKEFGFKITFPDANGWEIVANRPVGKDGSSYIVAAANQPELRSLSIISSPFPKIPAGELITNLNDAKASFEKGFLKSADSKVSSESVKVGGFDAHRVVALKKLPSGDVRHVVGIYLFARGRSFTISAATKIPFDTDSDLSAFIDSLKVVN